MLNFKIVCENSGSEMNVTEMILRDEILFNKLVKNFYEREKKKENEKEKK